MSTKTFDCGCQIPVLQERGHLRPLFDLDINHIPVDCPAVWEMLGKGRTKGVFQLESPLGRQWCERLKPESIEHLAALGAILRPGCLHSKSEDGTSVTELYCRRRLGEEPVTSYHPSIDEALATTYGLMIYQENAMEVARIVAGFSLQEADTLRSAVGKKIASKMAQVKVMFFEGVEKTGVIPLELGQELFEIIEKSQRYAFNKCVSADTVIKRDKGRFPTKYTVEHMFNIRNDLEYAKFHGHEQLRRKWKRLGNYGKSHSLCEDGRLRPNIVEDIQFAGIRDVYEITLENGSSIKVTDNHKFPTNQGIVTTGQIMESDEDFLLVVCGEYDSTSPRSYTWSDFTKADIKHRCQNNELAVNKAFGESNCGYTNGEWSKWAKNILLLPDCCAICGITNKKFEIHHKDGNRHHNEVENLERLCISCHKKKEYANGRTRKGEKGYPSHLVGIKSIAYVGEQPTYDVTMAAPNHTFTTDSNIVTCNSHSVSYALRGYKTAYLKAHFPDFFAAWIRTFQFKKKNPLQERHELVQEARLFHLEVEPPFFHDLRPKTYMSGPSTIRVGLTDIKGVGDKKLGNLRSKLFAAEEGGSAFINWDWMTFLRQSEKFVTKSVLENIIRVGGLRHFGKSRREMLSELKIWRPQTNRKETGLTDKERAWVAENCDYSLNLLEILRKVAPTKSNGGGTNNANRSQKLYDVINLLENPPTSLIDRPGWVIQQEEQFLGISLSISRSELLSTDSATMTCRDLNDKMEGVGTVACEIISAREHRTKKGKNPGAKMGFLCIADHTGICDSIVVFPQIWEQVGNRLYEGATVLLSGKQDNQSFIVEKVQ